MDNWREIQDRHGSLVWATVYRILKDDAESLDCCQDVFLEAFRRARQSPVENWPGLLRWLAAHRAIDRLRQRKRHDGRLAGMHDVSAVADTRPGPVDAAELNELMEHVRGQLTKLPSKQAEAFWLRCVEQLSYTDIAGQLGLDTGAVGVLVQRAKARLRKMLADLYPSHQRK
jgi:RNA polymerase sigma-70 factor (ECF subfamily)